MISAIVSDCVNTLFEHTHSGRKIQSETLPANSIGMPTPDIAIIKVGDDDEIHFGHEEASLLDIA